MGPDPKTSRPNHRIQQIIALATGDTVRQHLAEAAFTACAADPVQTERLTTRGLRHGIGGLLAAGRRISADALTPIPLETLLRLHEQTVDIDESPGFLDGRTGAALAEAGPGPWDECLLLS